MQNEGICLIFPIACDKEHACNYPYRTCKVKYSRRRRAGSHKAKSFTVRDNTARTSARRGGFSYPAVAPIYPALISRLFISEVLGEGWVLCAPSPPSTVCLSSHTPLLKCTRFSGDSAPRAERSGSPDRPGPHLQEG